MLVNLKNELAAWRQERYMGIVLHGEADCGKSRYIQQLIEATAAELPIFYFDLLEQVNDFPDKGIILEWSPRTFMAWLLPEIQRQIEPPHRAVVVDHLDFLFNLWDNAKKEEFIQRISHIEKAVFDRPILFILQDDTIIYLLKQEPQHGRKPFIFSYKQLEAM